MPFKRIIFLLLTVLLCASAKADKGERMAGNILSWLQQAQVDSIAAHATEQVNAMLPAGVMAQLWPQLQRQAGACQKRGAWKQEHVSEYDIYRAVLVFEKACLQMQVVLDKDGKMAGLQFTPAPSEAMETRGEKAGEAASANGQNGGIDLAYTERPTVIKHGSIELPAVLTLPSKGGGRCPLIVLVHGSGPQDMDETIGPNKPFKDLAYALAKKGIATLRYDKRTKVYGARTAEVSGGVIDYDTEVAEDAVQALKQAAEVPEADPERLFVLGHSLGGTLAPRIVRKCENRAAGFISLAGLARPFAEAVYEQLHYIATSQGADAEAAKRLAEQQKEQLLASLPAEYQAAMKACNPLAEAAELGIYPMLFIQGGHDYQVTKTDLELWQKALAGNPKAVFRFFPTLDHLMRELPSMAVPADYYKPGQPAPEVAETISQFILQTQ